MKYCIIFIMILVFIIGALLGKISTLSYENSKLQGTVQRQASAIQTLEKQKNSVDIPKYLDSIPDYD